MPAVFATAGMIIASGGGVFFGAGVTGVTRFTLMVLTLVVPWVVTPPRLAAANEIEIAPVWPPMPRPDVFAVAVSTVPSAPTTPEAGVTVSHGTSGVAVKV